VKADPKVIADLQSSCAMLATAAEQYRVDCKALKAIDLDWLAHKVKGWYSDSECHLELMLKRLFAFDADPSYTVGKVGSGGNVTDLLQRSLKGAQAMFDAFCTFRKNSWNARADSVPDLYEHAVQDIEKWIICIERELKLIEGMGLPGYIGSRLEDE
jgi:bacterioferritin (cytochrome b1)